MEKRLPLRTVTGDDPTNPTLALPCREGFARGQRPALHDEQTAACHNGA